MTTLGAANPDLNNAEAWGAYLTALRSSLQTSWDKAKSSYLTLKKVRTGLGLPFVAPGGGGESGGGGAATDEGSWSDSLENNILDLQAMAKVNVDALGDAVAGKRKLYYDVQSNDFAVEGLPGDLVRVKLSPEGYLSLVDAKGATTHVGGTIGNPLLVFGAAAVAISGAVTFVGAALVVMKTCDTISTIAEQKTLQTALIKQAELVQGGASTTEAAALTQGVFTGAANLARAKAEAKKEEPANKLADTITTVAYVGLGIGVIYLLAQMIPKMGRSAPAAAYLENPPRVMSGYALSTGKTPGLRGKDWMYARDDHWEHVVVDEAHGQYRFLGSRNIDGTKMFVWSEPSKQRYVAQTATSWHQGTR